MTHYEILGLDPSADAEQIESAHKLLLKRWHSDKFASAPEAERQQATAKLEDVKTAFAVLSDEKNRRQYDESLRSRRSRVHMALPQRASEFMDDVDQRIGEAVETGQQIVELGGKLQRVLQNAKQVFGKRPK